MGVVESLHDELAQGPVAAALAARKVVRDDMAAAVMIVDDARLDPDVRVAALLALALAAQDGAHVPDAALSALEDDVLVDAVLAVGAASAITGLLCAGDTRVNDGLRRYLALRMRAAGATGMNVAALCAQIGDLDAAFVVAMPVIEESLRRAGEDDPVVLSLALLVAEWGIAERVTAALASTPRLVFERALRAIAGR